jgi:hypothetical protein
MNPRFHLSIFTRPAVALGQVVNLGTPISSGAVSGGALAWGTPVTAGFKCGPRNGGYQLPRSSSASCEVVR